MATPQAALDLEAKMAANYNERKRLEDEWVAMKAEFDKIVDKDRLMFKLGINSAEDLEKIKALLTPDSEAAPTPG